MSDREVKTGQTMEDAWTKAHTDGSILPVRAAADAFELGWNAAIDSVIPPEGRFEVGDRVEFRYSSQADWTIGTVIVSDEYMTQDKPSLVRPLPKTVELTVEEKIDALYENHGPPVDKELFYRRTIELLDTDKTLDQLCADYGIPTTKEVS